MALTRRFALPAKVMPFIATTTNAYFRSTVAMASCTVVTLVTNMDVYLRQKTAGRTSSPATVGASLSIGNVTVGVTATMAWTSTIVHRHRRLFDVKSINAQMDPASETRSVATVDATVPMDTTRQDVLADRKNSPVVMVGASQECSCATDVPTAVMDRMNETVLVLEVNSAAELGSALTNHATAISASIARTDRTKEIAEHPNVGRVSGSAGMATASGQHSVATVGTIAQKAKTKLVAEPNHQVARQD